ncbi:MAG: MotA/TolQ/ExbB proton channel family protein [Candidatus Omnitrophica bacterium]|nr:MotA/TolQ/ExbB proton channel family protein [Candidatus Omnitrophota bacterium]MDD5138132.1 MotA/TolQ/ExbB proton channel family protein [Candidatus Omnitrophota bacterium]
MKERWLRLSVLCVCLVSSVILYLQNSLLRQGGWAVVPVLFCSLLGFTVVFAKIRQFASVRLDAPAFLKQIFEKLERQRLKEAIDLCEETDVPLSRVLRAGIIKYDHGKDEIKESMDNALRYEEPALEQHMALLSTLLDVLPLLGFLGTLLGITEIFYIFEAKEAVALSVGLGDVTGGVWQMVLAPLLALAVLVPLYVAFRFLSAQIKIVEADIDISCRELLSFLLERRMQS